METLAVFKSRSDAMRFYKLLLQRKIRCYTVNTPSTLRAGCGVSVVFNSSNQVIVTSIIRQNKFNSFIGFYSK